MIKRLSCILVFAVTFITNLYSVQTTYTFYNTQWASKIGTVAVSGSDGWICDKAGAGYADGKDTPQGYMYAGVQITDKADYKNAGATSVLSFSEIRRIVFNYCTNNSKGKGTLYVQVGEGDPLSISIERPEKDKGSINRDIEFVLEDMPTGKIRFYIDCTENSIYINSITIKAKDGSPNITGLTADAFQLVTDVAQLNDGDEIIFGVSGSEHNYIMGLYDEWNSRNNIYAIRGVYSPDRQTVNEKLEAVYTLHTGESDSGKYYAFADIDGYWLVASGGNPNHSNNNYLTIWDTIYSRNYGWYGAWTIDISADGSAEIINLGVSRSNKIQFNLNGNTPIFACYGEWSQTKPAIYRRVVISDPTLPYIKAPICNFGTVLLNETPTTGRTVIEVNAVNLTQTYEVKFRMPDDVQILPEVTAFIKDYVENIDDIKDMHFSVLQGKVLEKFSEQLVYFQIYDVNGYGNDHQNFYKEDLEEFVEAHTVPEFINVNTLSNGYADITYRIVNNDGSIRYVNSV